jgi:type I restriction enzyme S subunit
LKYIDEVLFRGSGLRHLQKKEFLNLEIPVPPLPVQQKIVRILDTIQSAVEVQEKIIEKTKELKKALMNLLFHYGLAGLRIKELAGLRVDELTSSEIKKLGLKLKKTEIGEIPEHWEVVRLGEVCELRKEQVIPNPKEKYVGLEHLNTGESRIRRYGLGSEVKSLKSKFYPKDILYGKLRPYLDKVAVAEFEGLCSTDLLVVAADEDRVLPNYLVELMHTSGFLSFVIGTMSGTNHPRTSWDSLRIFKIALPPLSEQKEIAEILQTIDQKIEIEKKKKELYYELFKTLLNKIMNQEIEVERIEI